MEQMNEKIKREILKLLSKRDYFYQEIKQKLVKKGFDEKEIEEALKYFVENKYIQDEKLKDRLKELAIEKGKSKLAIKKKLYQKGVNIDIEISFEEELQSALNLLRKKYKKEKEFKKIVNYLMNRGFGYSVAKEATKVFLTED